MKLTSDNVDLIFKECLFKDNEIVNGQPVEPPSVVEGVVSKVGLHPQRVKANEANIIELLKQLPDDFHEDVGGGTSFLAAMVDRNKVQWTGLHQRMEMLMILGLAIGRVKSLFPREDWQFLPGSMPYFSINVKEVNDGDGSYNQGAAEGSPEAGGTG